MENYSTLSFKTVKQAEKNESEIKSYFGDRYINSFIREGIDERGNNGYFVEYNLFKDGDMMRMKKEV